MRIVNPAILLSAVGALFYIFDYDHFDEVTLLDRWGDLQFDAQRCAVVVERDICSWIRCWPPQQLHRLNQTLDFHLEHDPTSLIERAQQDYEFWTEHPIEAVWQPLYRGVFGHDHEVRGRSEYGLLDTETLQQADLDTLGFTYKPHQWFDDAVSGRLIGRTTVSEPAPPDWPWLEPISVAAYERHLTRMKPLYLQPFLHAAEGISRGEAYLGLSLDDYQALDDGYKVASENRFQRFGHHISSQGLSALSQAVLHAKRDQTDWFHSGPELLGQPLYEFSDYGLGRVYCNPARMSEASGSKVGKINDVDDLLVALRVAATGLGLSLGSGMVEAIEQARKKEQERPSPFVPYATWATLSELALRARDKNLFLYLS